VLFISVFCIYLSGTSGAMYYDDFRPLSNLLNVNNLESALIYISTEISGVLGRTISMVTFLFNVNDWPNNTSGFLTFNIILHILNGLMVLILSYFILKLISYNNQKNYWIALVASAFWLVLPLHVSTSLIAIQRMAGLSAFFVFSGLSLYVYGLLKQKLAPTNNSAGLYYQLFGLILFTLLAIFSKENGLLLPIFILVLETTLFLKVTGIQKRKKLRFFAGITSLFIVLIYLIYVIISSKGVYSGRDFTLIERLQTQPQILLEYLRLAFIPNITAFNPFHDNYNHVQNLSESPKAIFSIIFWLVSFLTAMIFRKYWPIFSFAVLWFLVAHLLESTVIGLELYFEHRNYVALFGPCLAIIILISQTPEKYKKLITSSFIFYWLLLLFSLSQVTQLWGDQNRAAQTWYIAQPGSERSTEHLSLIYLNNNQIEQAKSILEHQVKLCPNCIGSLAQALLVSCIANDKDNTNTFYTEMLENAKIAKRLGSAPSALSALKLQIEEKNCTLLTLRDLKMLNKSLINVQGSSFDKKITILINLHQIAIKNGDKVENLRLLRLAWQEKQDNMIANILITHLLEAKLYDEAYNIANNQMCNQLSLNPLVAKKALQECSITKQRVNDTINRNQS